MIRILSLDGGGIRGLLSCYLLHRINQETPFLHKVDVFAGTSTGSLIALGLSSGHKIEDLIGFYENFSSNIFTPYPHQNLNQTPKYHIEPLKALLDQAVFPSGLKLSSISKKVVIPTFSLCDKEGWSPKILHNFEPDHAQIEASYAAASSCSAPFYFPSFDKKIDGGVFANHPGLYALLLAKQHFSKPLEDFSLLSIGTGRLPDKQEEDIAYGSFQWNDPYPSSKRTSPYPFFTLATQATTQAVDFYLSHLLGSLYKRVNPILEKAVALDETSEAHYLKEKALLFPKEYPAEFESLLVFIQKYF